ncbi:Clp protease N-terminal domain-containing protein [Jidongwangia harbinensis]|uniref:Clp protease N-terminal domain-containing protein n=1 Tax=Jidongwangia harbinensis TaxID=2878561 RepID=UPI001CD9F308|nr:Clp protease N-terminal domain-containing protein [Jidongwangia harbinensis]MCA2214086.1 hypothetical protein [Jidongwangia harbinensis]
MPVEFAGDTETANAVHYARCMGREEIGTDLLLAGLVMAAPRVARLLDAFDITGPVLRAVIRDHHHHGRWAVPDGPAHPDTDVTVAGLTGPTPFTGGAAAALIRCRELPGANPRRPEDLLAALLQDHDCRAAAVLRDCGADVDEVARAARTRERPHREERVAPALRVTRDMLIGRQRYRGRGLRDRLLSFAVRVQINYAVTPVMWVSLEVDEIAKRRGGRPRTDDILLAMLATYEVGLAYPHLSAGAADKYHGSRLLAATGFDHQRLAAAVDVYDLGTDGVSPKAILRRGDEQWPQDTAELLSRLLAHDNTRAARLLDKLGVDLRELAR